MNERTKYIIIRTEWTKRWCKFTNLCARGVPGLKIFIKALIGFFVVTQLVIALGSHKLNNEMEKHLSEYDDQYTSEQSYKFAHRLRANVLPKRELLVNDRSMDEGARQKYFDYTSHQKIGYDSRLRDNKQPTVGRKHKEAKGTKSSNSNVKKVDDASSNISSLSERVTLNHNIRDVHSGKLSSATKKEKSHISSKPLCPDTPPNLVGRMEINVNDTPPTLEEIASQNRDLLPGGMYSPSNCTARNRVAFIIPHRAREVHLRMLLSNLHPVLQRQQLYYRIFVVHQAGDYIFNKAKLMNAGFLELLKLDLFDCIVFHDVDLVPEDDRLLYTCTDTPKHLSVAIDKYNYELPYNALFGGVTIFTSDQFRDVNGFSNIYWGWGGEDDDMFNRVFARGYTITRPPMELARYKMRPHTRDKGNKANLVRFKVLAESTGRIQRDGLSNIEYGLVSIKLDPLYTNITINVGTAIVTCKSYVLNWTCGFVLWMCDWFGTGCGMLKYNDTEVAAPQRLSLDNRNTPSAIMGDEVAPVVLR